MSESFLHFLWRWKRFDSNKLQTTSGLPLDILNPGEWNRHSGPDFFNARIRMDGALWAGNVELHVQASEWDAHGHSSDPAYDNVLLHVVYEEDRPVISASGKRIPCLELKGKIPPRLIHQYRQLEQQRAGIPCGKFWREVPDEIREGWLKQILAERLELKSGAVLRLLEVTRQHQDEAFYRLLARNFGLQVNTEPFEMLAQSVPAVIPARLRSNLLQLEALFFGQAGLLERQFEEEYPLLLQREYALLRHKFGLNPMNASQWKFMRMRPSGFPTVRIARFAALLQKNPFPLSSLLAARNLAEMEELLSVELSDYWKTRYDFGKESAVSGTRRTGHDFIHTIILNTLVPFMYCLGKLKGDAGLTGKSLDLLGEIPPEQNKITRFWYDMGERPASAARTQALIHLKKHWCEARNCLECEIGRHCLG
ncbi:MAG: DUF2851 family protein [Bacteroidota bacterium]